jgi:hypothetical protein
MKLSLLLVFVSTSSSTLIPVTYDLSGSPRIDVEFGPDHQMRPHVVHLGRRGVAITMRGLEANTDATNNITVSIPTINGEPIIGVRHRHLRVLHYLCGPWTTLSNIGIGPGSDLLSVGEIDFVRQSNDGGFVRVGGTEQGFISNDCLPDSVMRMETFTDPFYNFRVTTRISVSIGDNVIATDFLSYVGSEGALLRVPRSWVADIYAALPPSAEFGVRPSFNDCAQTMERLPIITLTFTVGGLRLLPEDYTRRIGQDDRCELLILREPIPLRSYGWAPPMISFNPLLIPGINARATDNEIILCDSAIEL